MLNTQDEKSKLICEIFPDYSYLIPRIINISDDQAKELANNQQLFMEFKELFIDQKHEDASVSIDIIEENHDFNSIQNDSNHSNEDINEDGDDDDDYDDNETEFFKTEDKEGYNKQPEDKVEKESEIKPNFQLRKQLNLFQLNQQIFALQPNQPKIEEFYNNIDTFINCFDITLKMEDYDEDNYLDENEEEDYEKYQNNDQTFTICNVTNFPNDFTESDILKIFLEFGKPISSRIIYDDNKKSKQIGFCKMSNHEGALKAVEGLNHREINGFILRCGRAKFKSERRRDFVNDKERLIRAIDLKYKERLIYFQIFDETVTSDELKRIFSEFGEIVIYKIIRDKIDKTIQFGFICYKTQEQANECIKKSIFTIIHDKQLYTSKVMSREQQLKKQQQQNRLQFRNYNPMSFPQNDFNLFNPLDPISNPNNNQLSPNFYQNQPFYNQLPFMIFDTKSMLIDEAKGKLLDNNTLLQRIISLSDAQARELSNNQQIFSKFIEQSIDQEYKDIFAIIEHDHDANAGENKDE